MLPASFSSLRVRLLSLVLLAALPALGLVVYSDLELRRQAEARSLAQAQRLTDLACTNIDNAMADVRVVLQSLAQAPEVRALDAAAAEKLFDQVMARRGGNLPSVTRHASRGRRGPAATKPSESLGAQEPFHALALADLDGRVVASSVAPRGAVNLAGEDEFQLALATHDFAFSAHPADPLTDEPSVDAAYRVLGPDGQLEGMLLLSLDVGWLGAAVAGGVLPEGGSLLVLDSRGTVLVHFPESRRFIGRDFPDVPAVHEVLARRRGTLQAEGLSGEQRLWSFQPVPMPPGPDVYVALGFVPKAIFAEADRTARRMALVMVLVAGATGLALWLWARRFILQPTDVLTRATRRLREGHLSARAELAAAGELGELGRSFDEMAESLQGQARELRKSNQTLEAVLTSSPVAIIALDLDRRITMWTPAAERLFGWGAAEVLGREVPFTPPGQDEMTSALAARAARGEELADREWPARRKDGSALLLSVSTALLVGPEGVRGQVVAMVDLTARRQLERQLHHSQKMEALGRLAGGVAHDFNNLLTIVRGFNAMIVGRPGVDAATRDDAEQALEAAVRATALTGQLMAFSRRQPGPPRVVDLNDVVAGMILMLQRVVGEDIRIESRFLARPGWVKVDPGQIEQLLANLIVNAREAMPQGGRLVIETGNHECAVDPEQRCRPECPGPSVTLSVSDTGAGMDAATQRRLFEPVSAARERGAGSGLFVVHGIVEQYGGDLEVLSEPGRGSTFRISLPLVPGPEPAPATNGVAPAPAGSGTVLLVEDDDAVRALERAMLEHLGYRVLEARQGNEALAVAERHAGPIELLITDVVMPEMGGRAVAERLRRSRSGIRVLYLSGYAPGEGPDDDAALDATFLPKPFTLDALASKMREALEGPGSVG